MGQAKLCLQQAAAAAASEKKARDIVILDMRELTPVTDYFVICSANSTTQVQAIADNIEEKLLEQGVKPLAKEGYREARWILLDYGACVVHVFMEEDRQFYNLERLWGDAEKQVYQS
ncbi:MAG: ribosome silencing factor [Negativicutes bacterium]|nr:ribosome silencing factor [Negativicutes bacterium]